jgi:hypothetical protein
VTTIVRQVRRVTIATLVGRSTVQSSRGRTTIVDRGRIGPQGIQGVQGPPGPVGAFYLHTQASASASWTINHNLGFQPNVSIKNAGGVEVECEVVHTSNNQCVAYANTAFSGTARCS